LKMLNWAFPFAYTSQRVLYSWKEGCKRVKETSPIVVHWIALRGAEVLLQTCAKRPAIFRFIVLFTKSLK
jgi:hypothetical protein